MQGHPPGDAATGRRERRGAKIASSEMYMIQSSDEIITPRMPFMSPYQNQ